MAQLGLWSKVDPYDDAHVCFLVMSSPELSFIFRNQWSKLLLPPWQQVRPVAAHAHLSHQLDGNETVNIIDCVFRNPSLE